jgi:hypothetical protein
MSGVPTNVPFLVSDEHGFQHLNLTFGSSCITSSFGLNTKLPSYALHHTKLHFLVTFASLILLQ